MEGFMDRLANGLGKVATRINSWRYIMVIKNAFAALIPVIITGAFGTLFSAMVFDSENGLAKIDALSFLENLKPISSAVSYVTLSFLTIYAVFLIGIELAKLNKIDGVFPGIIAVMSYLSVNPMVFEFLHEDATVIAENVLAKQYTDTKGLFLACSWQSYQLNFMPGFAAKKDCKSRCRKVFLPMSQQVSRRFSLQY